MSLWVPGYSLSPAPSSPQLCSAGMAQEGSGSQWSCQGREWELSIHEHQGILPGDSRSQAAPTEGSAGLGTSEELLAEPKQSPALTAAPGSIPKICQPYPTLPATSVPARAPGTPGG